jgi:hypothetical protein
MLLAGIIRNGFFPCNRLEKLHTVFIKDENTVDTTNTAPLASDGADNAV